VIDTAGNTIASEWQSEMSIEAADLVIALLRRLLAHPMTAGLDLDDPATAELRGQVILSKRFPCPEHAVLGLQLMRACACLWC
jgi:hypothetical protein